MTWVWVKGVLTLELDAPRLRADFDERGRFVIIQHGLMLPSGPSRQFYRWEASS